MPDSVNSNLAEPLRCLNQFIADTGTFTEAFGVLCNLIIKEGEPRTLLPECHQESILNQRRIVLDKHKALAQSAKSTLAAISRLAERIGDGLEKPRDFEARLRFSLHQMTKHLGLAMVPVRMPEDGFIGKVTANSAYFRGMQAGCYRVSELVYGDIINAKELLDCVPMSVEDNADSPPTNMKLMPGFLCERIGICNETLRKGAVAAGINRPGSGESNFVYTPQAIHALAETRKQQGAKQPELNKWEQLLRDLSMPPIGVKPKAKPKLKPILRSNPI